MSRVNFKKSKSFFGGSGDGNGGSCVLRGAAGGQGFLVPGVAHLGQIPVRAEKGFLFLQGGMKGLTRGKGEQQRCGTRVTASMSTHKTYTPLLMRTQNTWGRRHKKPVALVSPGRGLGGWRGDKRLTLSYTPPHLIIYEPLK